MKSQLYCLTYISELYFGGKKKKKKKPHKTGSDPLWFVANANGPGTVRQHSEDGRGV